MLGGIGDDNPLWCNADHGNRSRWGERLAPPCFYYAVDETSVASGYSDRRRLYRHVQWTFYDVLKINTALTASTELLSEKEFNGDIEQFGQVNFYAAQGQHLASANTRCVRRLAAAPSIEERAEIRYSGAQLDAIETSILSEQRRGQQPRLWEKTSPGEALGPLLKGPLSIMDVVAWCAATTGVAQDDADHSEGGLHDQCATGPQLTTWVSQLLTDWMGDDGFLHSFELEIFELPPLGSTTKIQGQVTALTKEPAGPTACVELQAHSYFGSTFATGHGKILLPSEQHGPVRLPLAQ